MLSCVEIGSKVTFPEWLGERHYMLPFTLHTGLPREVERYQSTIDQMMAEVAVDRDQECYFMVDEKIVEPGVTHRRAGLHVEGYWHPKLHCHSGGGHCPAPPAHGPTPTRSPTPRPIPDPKEKDTPKTYWTRAFSEGVILASNYTSARALIGHYERDFVADWRKGDCSDLDTAGLQEITLQGGIAYHMDVFTLHESLPVRERIQRTLIRLNVPGWSPRQGS